MEKKDLYTALKSCIKKSLDNCFPNLNIDFELNFCKELSQGDFYSNVIFKLARLIEKTAGEIKDKFLPKLEEAIKANSFLKNAIKEIDFKLPGFINFFLSEEYLSKTVFNCLSEGDKFGSSSEGKNESVLIEFVSANPTGPLSIAHGRQAAIGDALANIFSFLGYRVEKEYYINDEGTQIENLAKSIWVRYRELLGEKIELPPDGYKGDYIVEVAKKLSLDKEKYKEWNQESKEFFIEFGCKEMLRIIKEDLDKFGIRFDNWISQASLNKSSKVKKVINFLKEKDFMYEKDGAIWLKSTLFGDDKDRVVVKSDGSFTYIASDLAYHKDKYERGYNLLINLWGPDHHGYIPRLRAGIKAMGYDDTKLKIIIVQLATLYRNGEMVPMSTRAGKFITLEEIIREIGKDVAKFFFLNRRLDSHLDFDIELAKKESKENPVYYIQYAHARINSLKNYAYEKGIDIEKLISQYRDVEFLISNLGEEEFKIIRILQQFPYTVKEVTYNLEPNILIVYLQNLAKYFHHYYSHYRIIDSDSEKSYAKMFVALAVGVVLRNGLRLLGISFPERM